jgi:hypothetical protein
LRSFDADSVPDTDTSAGKGNTTTTLAVQNDGNVVLYNGTPM